MIVIPETVPVLPARSDVFPPMLICPAGSVEMFAVLVHCPLASIVTDLLMIPAVPVILSAILPFGSATPEMTREADWDWVTVLPATGVMILVAATAVSFTRFRVCDCIVFPEESVAEATMERVPSLSGAAFMVTLQVPTVLIFTGALVIAGVEGSESTMETTTMDPTSAYPRMVIEAALDWDTTNWRLVGDVIEIEILVSLIAVRTAEVAVFPATSVIVAIILRLP